MCRYLLLLAALFAASCDQAGLQPRGHYEAALANTSLSPSLVRIQLTRNGKTEVTCVFARRLLWAITVESGVPTEQVTQQAYALAKANVRHAFRFENPKAIGELGLDYDKLQRREACSIIASGKPALRVDYSGEIAAAMPMGSE